MTPGRGSRWQLTALTSGRSVIFRELRSSDWISARGGWGTVEARLAAARGEAKSVWQRWGAGDIVVGGPEMWPEPPAKEQEGSWGRLPHYRRQEHSDGCYIPLDIMNHTRVSMRMRSKESCGYEKSFCCSRRADREKYTQHISMFFFFLHGKKTRTHTYTQNQHNLLFFLQFSNQNMKLNSSNESRVPREILHSFQAMAMGDYNILVEETNRLITSWLKPELFQSISIWNCTTMHIKNKWCIIILSHRVLFAWLKLC